MLTAGCDKFLCKPFRNAEFFRVLGRHLGLEYVYAEKVKEAPCAPSTVVDTRRLATLPKTVFARLCTAMLLDVVEGTSSGAGCSGRRC